MDRGAWVLCAALAAGAVPLWILAVSRHAGAPDVIPLPVLALTLLAALRLKVPLRFRENTLDVRPDTVVVAIGIALDRPLAVLIAVVAATAIDSALSRLAPVKAAFNILNLSTVAALGEVIFGAIAVRGDVATVSLWLALATVCLIVDAVTVGLVHAAIALSGGRVGRKQLAETLLSLGLIVPTNAVLSIMTVSAIQVSVWGYGLVAALVLGAVFLLRRQRDLEVKHDTLELLYNFTDRLAGLTEATDVVATALRSVEELLNCRDAELVTRRGDSFERMALHPNGALVHQEDIEPGMMEHQVLETGEPLLVTRAQRHGAVGEDLARRGWRDAVLVPVRSASHVEGVLLAAERLGETATFTPADQRLLETLAAHSSVALRGSELLDRLRGEVKARSYEALHDSLTGLGNRNLFHRRLEAALDRAGAKPVAVAMFDLDNFKEINDTLGHHTGDEILREVAERISRSVGDAGMACRIGGDEFAVIIPDPASAEEAFAIASRARESLATPLRADAMTFSLQAGVGVAVAPEDGGDAASLLRRADVAMYAAKADKTGVERYDPARDPNTTRRLRLTSDLRTAIDDGGIELWYQPKAELVSGRVVGVEALARWTHERYGFIPPDEFVALAEQTGSIGPLTLAVLSKAMLQKKVWDRMGLQLDVAVNVSARNLLDTELVARLRRLLDVHGIDPGTLVIELTESSVMTDAERSEKVLNEVAALGVRVAVDDFGTGYSSLSRLSCLPVSEIKVDKSFVTNMLTSNTEPIVTATIELAASLGQTVTAEGVEDRATWERLRELGCDFVQGYFLARPMQADVATDWLADAGQRRTMLRPARTRLA